jgi:hypothetical protein
MDYSWVAGCFIHLEKGPAALSALLPMPAARRLTGHVRPMRMHAAVREEDVAVMDPQPASACCLIDHGFNLLKTAGAG